MQGFSPILSKKTYETSVIKERVSLSVTGQRGYRKQQIVSIAISSSLADAMNWKRSTAVGFRVSDDKTRIAICPTRPGKGWTLTAYGNTEVMRVGFKIFEELGFIVSANPSQELEYTKVGNSLIISVADFPGLTLDA